jgi:hypothetical protein
LRWIKNDKSLRGAFDAEDRFFGLLLVNDPHRMRLLCLPDDFGLAWSIWCARTENQRGSDQRACRYPPPETDPYVRHVV